MLISDEKTVTLTELLFDRDAECPMTKFSWLAEHGRVTIARAIPMATLLLPR
jgi:hypothetical protein